MTKIFIFLVFSIYVGNIYAQHTEHHSVSPKNKVKELTFKAVLEAQLSVEILKDYSMQSTPLLKGFRIYFHFLSGRCQTFVSLRIWISPWYAANLAFKKKAFPV